MSHKSTSYTFSPSPGYAPPLEGSKQEGYLMDPPIESGYPKSQPSPQPMPMPMVQPEPTQTQPGYQPGYPSGPGYPSPGYPGNQPPVIQQPAPQGPIGSPDNAVSIPPGLNICPPGLEYLTMIDQLLVHQKVEAVEIFTGFESKNKYTIKNSVGQRVYQAVEESEWWARACLGSNRPFHIRILDNFNSEVIHIRREMPRNSCFCPCGPFEVEVSAPPGTFIGSIKQESSWTPRFSIKNAAGEEVLKVEGPLCPVSCFGGDVNFYIYAKDGVTKVGKITKEWAGLAREMFTDADHFGISFPMDLDVKVKAVLLGACFLIDFIYFEQSGN